MKKATVIVFLVLLLLPVFAFSVSSQELFPTPTATADFSVYADVFATHTPSGPVIVGTPDQPLDLLHLLDHGDLIMVPKHEKCASRVAETGEDCTSVQGQQFTTIRHALKNQIVRVSGDGVMIIVPSCPADPAERALVEIGLAPIQYKSLVDQAVGKLKALGAAETCFFAPNLYEITGTFYNSILMGIEDDYTYFAIVVPEGGDITTFVPDWLTAPTNEAWTMLASVSVERVVIPPQHVTRFEPDATNVPNCAGSLRDMALSVNPNAVTLEELTAALHQFIGMGCENLNLIGGSYSMTRGSIYHLRGVYARYLNPSYYELTPYLFDKTTVISTATVTPTLTPTPTS